jgi:seryl-tRNA synthetase
MFEIALLEIVKQVQGLRASSQRQAKEITKSLRTSDKLLSKLLSQNTDIKEQLATVQARADAEDKLLNKLSSMLNDSIDKDLFIKDRIGNEIKEKALQKYVASMRGIANE